MTPTNIAAVDLNLLLVLHVVTTEQSATRAAKRLGVTQSAVSNALARLREMFGDPLFVRHARGLTPTPRATELASRLAPLLEDVRSIVAGAPPFDPSTTTREFTLACADYYGMVMLPLLTETLHARAPFASLRIVTLEQLVSGEGLARDVDVHVGRPPTLPSGCRVQALFDEKFVCLTRPEGPPHARARRTPTRMSLREYRDATHVRIRVLDSVRDPIDVALEKQGVRRKVALTVPHFSLAPLVVLQTGYVATLSGRLAALYASILPLAVRKPPVEMAPRPVQMIWHERTDADPGARFFRDIVAETSKKTPKHWHRQTADRERTKASHVGFFDWSDNQRASARSRGAG